jgi:L-Ala-D/L-Glu epimerase
MKLKLTVAKHLWLLKQPVASSRGVLTSIEVVVVWLEQAGHTGRGEGHGVSYHGETSDSMLAQIESVRSAMEAGTSREELLTLLPAGGARNALDAALWDLEAKQTGVPVWRRAGLESMQPVTSAITIGIGSIEAYEARARALSAWPWIKIKVGNQSPLEAVEAVRRGAPRARLIVDANRAWSIVRLRGLATALAELNVELLEQPIPGKTDKPLRKGTLPIPICAHGPADTAADLQRLAGRYDFINIKLDKAGGLTAALAFARAARMQGLRLMVGCMTGSSLAMAPAMVLAQLCEVVDLEGPLLIAGDWSDGIEYHNGLMSPARLWG